MEHWRNFLATCYVRQFSGSMLSAFFLKKLHCYFFICGQLDLFLIKEDRDRNYRALNRRRGAFFALAGCSLFGWLNGTCAKTCVL
jgi:hypothetical protein